MPPHDAPVQQLEVSLDRRTGESSIRGPIGPSVAVPRVVQSDESSGYLPDGWVCEECPQVRRSLMIDRIDIGVGDRVIVRFALAL
jgi:hypothetical protein